MPGYYGSLRQQSHQFGGAVHTLWVLHQTFNRAKLRNYDLPTAVDVLGSGSYCRLPTVMKSLAIPPKPMSIREKAKITERLDDLMRTRLFCDERPPPAFRHYVIGEGVVKFKVKDEFEVSLTLDGAELSKPWRVMEARCLVTADPTCCREVQMKLVDYQGTHLVAYAQHQLLPKTSTISTTTDTEQTRPPLYRLYGFMHNFALMTQLEIMFTQALYLSRTRWEEHMTCTMDGSHTVLRLNYWCRKIATTVSTPATTARAYNQQPLTALPVSRVASESMPNIIDIALETTESKDQSSRSRPLKDTQLSTNIVVKCSSTQVDTHKLTVDSTAVNVEKLLLTIVNQHALDIVTSLRERLLQPSTQPDAFVNEDVSDITIPMSNDTTDQVASVSFTVQYQSNRAVSVGVDIRTGRILFDHQGDVGHVIFAKLKEIENSVNRDPNCIADVLLRFRRELLLVDLESMARRLDLLPVRQLFLRPQDWHRFGDGLGCITFFRLPRLPDAYIVSGVKYGRLHLWLITVGAEDEHCIRSLSYMTTIHLNRLQETKHINNEGEEDRNDVEAIQNKWHRNPLITFTTFARMVAYCQIRVLYLKIEQQLAQLNIRYRWSPTPDLSTVLGQLNNGPSSAACLLIRSEDLKIQDSQYASGAFGDIRVIVATVSNSDTDINSTTITMASKQMYNVYFQSDIQWTPWFSWSRASHQGKYNNASIFVQNKTLTIVCRNVTTCIDEFLSSWQRTLHMSHLARQLASTAWRQLYGVEIVRFDFTQLVLKIQKLYNTTSTVELTIDWQMLQQNTLSKQRGDYRLSVSDGSSWPTLSLLERHLSRYNNLRSVIELSSRMLSILDVIHVSCPTAQIYTRDVNSIRVYHSEAKYGLDIILEPNAELRLVDVKEWVDLKSPMTATTPTNPQLPLPMTDWTKVLRTDWRSIDALASAQAISSFLTAALHQSASSSGGNNDKVNGELIPLSGAVICRGGGYGQCSVGLILLGHLLQEWSTQPTTLIPPTDTKDETEDAMMAFMTNL
ncbi:mediator complex subunit MED14-domain-containing protein [Syncephalis fuscata]|nr:mediator complex subunit MED14-domain-containing protein [Syncephalis fuscata]